MDTQGIDMHNNNNNNKLFMHIRGDSETELDLLFSVLNSNEAQQTQTFRNKNLPLSFFQPPEPKTGAHNRDGSVDGAFASAQCAAAAEVVRRQNDVGFHSRSHSSPANLPLAFSFAPKQDLGLVDSVIGDRASQQLQAQVNWAPATCFTSYVFNLVSILF